MPRGQIRLPAAGRFPYDGPGLRTDGVAMAEYEKVSFREPSVWPRVLAVVVALIGAPIVLWTIVSFVHTHVGPPAIPAPRMTLAAQTTSPAPPPQASPTVPAPTLADLSPTPVIAPPPAEPRADPAAGKTAREAVAAASNPTPAEPEAAPKAVPETAPKASKPTPGTALAARAPDPAPAETKPQSVPDPAPARSLRAPGDPFNGMPAMDITPLLAVPGMPGPVEAEAVRPDEPSRDPVAGEPKPETAETVEPGTPIAGPVPLPPVRPKRTAARPIPLPRARPDSIPAPSLTAPVRPSDDRFPVR